MPTSHNTPAPNVLQITPELDTGGVERSTVDMARGIVEAGGKALVATRGGRLQSEVEDAGGQVINLPVHSKNPFTILANILRLRRIIERENINIVHVRSRAPAWSALPAARLTRTPLVTTYHGTYTAHSALKRLYNSGMARGDTVMANSEFIAERIRSEHASLHPEPRIVYSGTDMDLFDPGVVSPERQDAIRQAWSLPKSSKTIILLPGRLTEWKGQKILVEAAGRLKASGISDFLIILAGDPQGRDNYEKDLWDLIRQMDLTACVRMPGHCSDIAAAYAVSDIVISASTQPEAFGRVAVEAQAMAKPIIASDHGGSKETVIRAGDTKTGWRVTPRDPDALASALREALSLGHEERRAMGQNGRINAMNFSVKTMIRDTLEIYQELLIRQVS